MELPDIYIVFVGMYYYPSGGSNDFVCTVTSKEVAISQLHQHMKDDPTFIEWGHVFSVKEGKIIYTHTQ